MKKSLLLTTLILTGFALYSQIINIPADYPTIQEGIDASEDGDTVLVQTGLYQENLTFNGKSIVLASTFIITNDTNSINQTIIDGQWWDEVIQIINNEDSTTYVIGFSIKNGVRGILISNADANIVSCKVFNNSFPSDAGGGGIGISGYGQPGLDYNTASVINCDIYNNHCRHGGGISVANNRGVIENCKIYNNTNYENGNQIQFWNTSTILRNCYIKDTQIEGFDVIEFRGGCDPILENNIILSNNTLDDESVFLSWEASSPVLFNNTIVNTSDNQGNLITINPPSHFTIYNSIAYGYVMNSGMGYTTTYCRFDNIPEGEGNISDNPLLNADYSLSDCSPCIGAGVESVVFDDSTYYAPVFDYLYNNRPMPITSNPDMGAIENEFGVPNTPPSITQQPTGTSQCEGGSHTMTVTAEGSPVISYQWQKDGVDLLGEESNILILNNVTESDEANYRCLVSNSCETIISNQAYVEVLEAPEFTQHPASQTKYFGNNVLFEVEVTGDDTITYQWYGPSGLLAGETSDQLLVENITAADTGNYYCTATNSCGSDTSLSALLTAYEQLVANAGSDIGIDPGDSTQLNGSYTGGSPSISISWSPDSLLHSSNILSPHTVPLYQNHQFTLDIYDSVVQYTSTDTMSVLILTSDTLNYYGPEEDTTYMYTTKSACGYISGTNCDGDKIKAQYFSNEMLTYDLDKVLIRFGNAVKTSEDEVMIKVGVWDHTGANNSPGNLLDFTTIELNEIVSDVEEEKTTEINFSSTVECPRHFYVGVFLPQAEGDTLAIYTNRDGNAETGLAWSLTADDEWISYSSDPRFYLRVSNTIFPVVKINNVGMEEINIAQEQFILFPNPATSELNVKAANNNTDTFRYGRIFDIKGKFVKRFNSKTVNLESLNPGIYVVELNGKYTRETKRLVINK